MTAILMHRPTDGTTSPTSTASLFCGDGTSAVTSSRPAVNNGSTQNLPGISPVSVSARCLTWILCSNADPFPYCISSPKPSLSKRICDYTHEKVVMCNIVEYAQPLPVQYQVRCSRRWQTTVFPSARFSKPCRASPIATNWHATVDM